MNPELVKEVKEMGLAIAILYVLYQVLMHQSSTEMLLLQYIEQQAEAIETASEAIEMIKKTYTGQ